MLPSLTLAFTCGLVVGSLIPYFPFSLSLLLFTIAIGLSILEVRQRVAGSDATAGFCCLLLGVIYWIVAVEGFSKVVFVENEQNLLETLTGRIIAPVQQASDRLLMVVKRDGEIAEPGRPRLIRLTWRMRERLLFEGDRVRFRAKRGFRAAR